MLKLCDEKFHVSEYLPSSIYINFSLKKKGGVTRELSSQKIAKSLISSLCQLVKALNQALRMYYFLPGPIEFFRLRYSHYT